MKFTSVMSGENRVTLLWGTGPLQGAMREFLVPLDSTLTQAVFTLSVDNRLSTMDVLTPSGAPITSATGSADITELKCGQFVVLNNPIPGLYRVRLSGAGRFWMEVTGKSELFLQSARFVELVGVEDTRGYSLYPVNRLRES